jgi:hypothetical protein
LIANRQIHLNYQKRNNLKIIYQYSSVTAKWQAKEEPGPDGFNCCLILGSDACENIPAPKGDL